MEIKRDSQITLRRLRATDADLAEVAAKLRDADSEVSVKTFNEESLRNFLADPNHFYLVGYVGEELAGMIHGYLLLHPAGVKYLYIDEVDTVKAFRRQGVARTMMGEVLTIGREMGASDAWLGTEDDNEPAKALYEGLNPTEIENGPIYTWKIK